MAPAKPAPAEVAPAPVKQEAATPPAKLSSAVAPAPAESKPIAAHEQKNPVVPAPHQSVPATEQVATPEAQPEQGDLLALPRRRQQAAAASNGDAQSPAGTSTPARDTLPPKGDLAG